MIVRAVNALEGLRSSLLAPQGTRDEVFIREVMEPLRPFWEVGLRFMGPAGREVSDPLQVARLMRFYRPELGVERGLAALEEFEREGAWEACVTAFEQAARLLEPGAHGVKVPEATFTFVLADPDGMDTRLGGYTGVGNVPGWSLLLAWPTAFNLPRLPAIVSHEFHHNVRFVFEPAWPMTLGQYLVIEGLAESFAAHLHGEDMLGLWTTGMTREELDALRPRFARVLLERNFDVVRGFIFGDWAASAFRYEPQGVPDFAGYAMGYRMVQEALRRTGWTPVDATYRSWQEVVKASGWFEDAPVDGTER